MSGHRVAFAAVLVAAAWSTAITGLTLVGAAKAEAAWLKSGPGTAAARALTLTTPGTPVVETAKCNNSPPGYTATIHWAYTATPVPGFEVLVAATANSTNPTVYSNVTSPTTVVVPGKNSYLSVRAAIGAWRSPRSTEVTVC